MHLINTFNKLKKNEAGYLEYCNGNSSFKTEYDEYLKAKEIIEKYGFDEYEILSFKESYNAAIKAVNKEIKDVKKELELISNVKAEYFIDEKDLDKYIDEYENIPEHYEEHTRKQDKKL